MLTDQLYSYLTQPEQFTLMADIVGHAPSVRLRLLTEFWDMTENRIQTELTPEGWYFSESSNRFDTWGGFYLAQDKNFSGVCIGVESIATNFFYGINFNVDKTKHLNRSAIDQYLLANNLNDRFKKSNHWLRYRYYGVNFNNLSECIHLIPNNREAYSMQVSTDIINFCRKMSEHLPKINNLTLLDVKALDTL